MKTIHHPTLEASREVEEADLPDWLASGWLEQKPERDEESDSSSPKSGSKADLEKQAANLGLPTDGTKADLEQRIAEANAQ